MVRVMLGPHVLMIVYHALLTTHAHHAYTQNA